MNEDLYCSIHPLIGEIQNAIYKVPAEVSYRHNCLIEALPEPLPERKMLKAVTLEPNYDEAERQLPTLHRIRSISKIYDCFFPLFEHVILYQKIYNILCDGYFSRNPIRSSKIKQLNLAFPNLDFKDVMPRIPSRAKSMSIVGPSGAGKSKSVERILGFFPQAIVHVEYEGVPFDRKQLVWLKVSVPPNGSPVALVKEMMFLIDQVLGSRYFEKYINKNCGLDTLLLVIKSQIGKLALGLLVIDEIHRLALAKNEDEYKLMEFFNELPESLGIPVLLIGNRRIENLFDKKRLSTNRRYLGNPDHVFAYFAKDKYWDQFIKRLWRYQWTNIKTPIDNELNESMFWHSVGIVDIAVKLFMMLQWKLIADEGDEIITEEVIQNVYVEYLSPIHDILNALRKGDSSILSNIDDAWISLTQLEELKQMTSHKITRSGVLDSLENQELTSAQSEEVVTESPVLQIAAYLISVGFPRGIAVKSAEAAVKRFAHDTERKYAFAEAFRHAAILETEENSLTESASEPTPSVKKTSANSIKKVPAAVVSLSGDLREIHKRAKSEGIPIYEALKAAGYIKAASEFLDCENA